MRGGSVDHSKRQTLKYQKGYATTDGDSLPVVGRDISAAGPELHVQGDRLEDTRRDKPAITGFTAAARPPQWVELDRQVLNAAVNGVGSHDRVVAGSLLGWAWVLHVLYPALAAVAKRSRS